eukprot:2500944-Pyramimonas_sp.AAC.1
MKAHISLAQKIQTFDAPRSAWKAQVRRAQNPIEIIEVPPPPPSQHEEKCPAVFARAYVDG